MEVEGRHFSFVILDEAQSRTIDLYEEGRFRFGIDIEPTEQLISFSPDCSLDSSGKRGGRRKTVLADAG